MRCANARSNGPLDCSGQYELAVLHAYVSFVTSAPRPLNRRSPPSYAFRSHLGSGRGSFHTKSLFALPAAMKCLST